MLISQPIAALHGGVSQQAASIRSPSQCEAAENVSFSLAEGASKRPPLEVIANLQTAAWSNAYFHYASTEFGESLVLVIPGNGSLLVFRRSDGALVKQLEELGEYMTDSNPKRTFRAFTVGDKTYIVNSRIQVVASDNVTAGSIHGSAQTLQDSVLDNAPEGSIWRLMGDPSTSFDTYYAKKVNGRFVEWVKPNTQDTINEATMPQVLRIFSDQVEALGVNCEFGPVEWGKKLVGDEESNKFPSFVGRRIRAVTFASDRLGFVAGNGIVFSETGEHHNFFRTTVTDVLDSDRIDVSVAADENAELLWAKPMHKSIILLSKERQFSFDWNGALTPSTVSVTQATAYPAAAECEPVSAGANLYFASESGNFAHLMEMYIQEQTVVTDAANVTSHIPRYVPAGLVKGAASSNHSHIVLLSEREPDTLYSYQFYYNGSEKVQSAWGKWRFEGIRILDVRSLEDSIWLVYEASHTQPAPVEGEPPVPAVIETFLGRIRLKVNDPGAATGDFPHAVHLDQLHRAVGEYNAAENRTYFAVPFPLGDAAFVGSAQAVIGHGASRGTVRTSTSSGVRLYRGATPYSFYFVGDWSSGPVYIGLPYEKRLTLSEQFVDTSNRASLVARLQIRTMTVNYLETAYFKTEVAMRGAPVQNGSVFTGASLESSYTARTLGDAQLALSTVQLASGNYRFPVFARSSDVDISLINDSHLPSNFVSCEWEGLVTTRTRR